ncbi:unnamed protein product [Lactuca virosa]|uniref:Uncharacterized protein n=1 Tax=Lactuca virosa TaxID=75947 RepID=A0AAU9PSA3_9ASTR|nr:unnamed protein product [Lactuca virosa]
MGKSNRDGHDLCDNAQGKRQYTEESPQTLKAGSGDGVIPRKMSPGVHNHRLPLRKWQQNWTEIHCHSGQKKSDRFHTYWTYFPMQSS